MKKFRNEFCMSDGEELRILICYIFGHDRIKLDRNIVVYCLQTLGIASFFDLNSAISNLIKNAALTLREDGTIELSEQGKIINESLNSVISQNIKNKSMKKITEYSKVVQNMDENNVTIKKAENGYIVNCSISGRDSDLMQLSIGVPNTESALDVKKNFYSSLSEIYVFIMSKLLGNHS